ncbi:MAG: hypothetical protein KA479_08065 [Saprospiraceae bacterium]|nr:hypothetical protein [Saprospiraceae bacterium]
MSPGPAAFTNVFPFGMAASNFANSLASIIRVMLLFQHPLCTHLYTGPLINRLIGNLTTSPVSFNFQYGAMMVHLKSC